MIVGQIVVALVLCLRAERLHEAASPPCQPPATLFKNILEPRLGHRIVDDDNVARHDLRIRRRCRSRMAEMSYLIIERAPSALRKTTTLLDAVALSSPPLLAITCRQRFIAAHRMDPGALDRALHGNPLTIIFFDKHRDLGRFQITRVEASLDVALQLRKGFCRRRGFGRSEAN